MKQSMSSQRTECVHTLWSMKFFLKADANLFFHDLPSLAGKKIASDQHNNIVVNTPTGDIILDPQIKTHDGWVTGVDFLCKAKNERAVSATTLPKRNVNNIHIELGHPSETSPEQLLKPLAFKSPVLSNHVNIAPWVKPSSMSSVKMLYFVQKC